MSILQIDDDTAWNYTIAISEDGFPMILCRVLYMLESYMER